MKNLLTPSVNSVLKKLGLMEAASTAGSEIHNNILGSEKTALTISNKEIKDITKIVKSLETSALLKKAASENNLK